MFRQFIQTCVCAEALKCKCKASDVQNIFNKLKPNPIFWEINLCLSSLAVDFFFREMIGANGF